MTTSLHSTVLQPAPSLPPSPTSTGSISHGDLFEVQRRSSSSSTSKGKEKQPFDKENREDGGDDHTANGQDELEGTSSSAETAAQTRRVEEVRISGPRFPLVH